MRAFIVIPGNQLPFVKGGGLQFDGASVYLHEEEAYRAAMERAQEYDKTVVLSVKYMYAFERAT